MLNRVFLSVAAAALLVSPALAQPTDNGIKGIILPKAKVELIQEGYKFTEGPVGTAKGELYFTDNRANQILLLDRKGKISLAYDKTDNANGLALSRSGELFEVQGVGKKVNKRDKDGRGTTLSEGIGGNSFMAPNDLILDAKGGIYFTDPGPRPVVPDRKAYVYYLAPGAKEPIVVDDTLVRPNGLTLADGGRTLIVDDSVSDVVSAWDVQRDGSVKNKRTLIKLHDIPDGKESGADGMAVDITGRLYIATITGVQVFDGKGAYLGTIKVPRQPSNVAFAGKKKAELYITAREGLYRISTLTKGPTRLGK
jgi:gluconolactonase